MRHPSSPAQFVDRARELGRLQAALERAAGGDPSVMVVAAEAGVGKSRLLAEFAARVDGLVLWGGCLPMAEQGLPFAPLAEALRVLAGDPERGDRIPASLVPLVSGEPGSGGDQVLSRSQLFQAILSLLERLADEAVTVVVLEDLHWADPSTRDLLTFLVPNLRNQRLLVVGSCRTDDLQRDHPLRPILAELSRQPHVQRLDLPPFTLPQVAEQLGHLTGRQPSAETVERVAARTQGNAYFVEELVAAGLDGRRLPTSLRELLLVRADVVSPPARRLLRIASLAQDEASDALLAQVSGVALPEVRAHLHEAIDAQLVVSTAGGVRFRHALLREVLQQDLLAGERAEYHAAYAEALGDRESSKEGGAAELAFHLQEAGDVTRAMGAWVDAAAAAEAVFAFAEAHQHLSKALAAWDNAAHPEQWAGSTRVELLARTAEDAFLGGDAERACTLVREAIADVGEREDPRRAGILYERLSRYLRDTAERSRVYEAIERAVPLVPASPPSAERARVLSGLAGRITTLGRLREAREVSREAVEMARRVGAPLVECEALNTLGAVTCYLEDDTAGLAHIETALGLARSCGDAHQQMRSYWNRAVCASEAGRWEEAIDRYREAIAALPRLGLVHLVPELHTYAAEDLMTLGRWDEAQAFVDEAARRFPSERDEVTPIRLVIGRGDFEEARRLVTAAGQRGIFIDEEARALVMVDLAELEVWQGDFGAARAAVDDALRLILHTDRPIGSAHALRVALRCEADAAGEARMRKQPAAVEEAVARGTQRGDQMRELVARPGPEGGWKREVRVLAAICEGERSRLAGSPDPHVWAEAVRAAQALSMRYHLAYTRVRFAEALVAAGDRDEASAQARDAYEDARSMGARPLTALVERFARRARLDVGASAPSDSAFGLTAREREVLDLVAQGASNRRIAEQLFISEKTAGVHVSNILRKLGVANRGQAASLAYRTGLSAG